MHAMVLEPRSRVSESVLLSWELGWMGKEYSGRCWEDDEEEGLGK